MTKSEVVALVLECGRIFNLCFMSVKLSEPLSWATIRIEVQSWTNRVEGMTGDERARVAEARMWLVARLPACLDVAIFESRSGIFGV